MTDDHKRLQAKKAILIEDFKFILKDFYLRMGSPEIVKESVSSTNQSNDSKQKLTAYKSRYFGESKEKAESENSSIPNKKPALLESNKNYKKVVKNTNFKAKPKVKSNKVIKKK